VFHVEADCLFRWRVPHRDVCKCECWTVAQGKLLEGVMEEAEQSIRVPVSTAVVGRLTDVDFRC